jgi:hypothetical protein
LRPGAVCCTLVRQACYLSTYDCNSMHLDALGCANACGD